MATPEENFTAEAPQRSPQASMSDATPPSSDASPPVRRKSTMKAQNAVEMEPVGPSSDASPAVTRKSTMKAQNADAMEPAGPSSDAAPPVRRKSTMKAQNAVAMEPAAGGKLCHNPVKARSGKDMIGAHTERSTGITYPYNMWGPCNPTRFGPVGEMPPERGHRHNYQGKHENLMKDRLEEQDFGHVRHHCYRKNLVEPIGSDSLAYMDHKRKEFWRTDVERVLKQDEEKRRERQKELLRNITNEEAWRRHNAQNMRDMKYQAYLDLSEDMKKVGCRNNLSGAPHINIITREPIGEHNIKVVKFRDDCTEYKRAQRTLMLRERNSGARNYNILNWMENPPGPELPPWLEKPPSPPPPPPLDTRTPLNSSKAAISCGRLYGAFGKFNIP